MKLALQLSKFGRNNQRVIGIGEHPKTYSTKRSGGECSGAHENAIFYEEIPLPRGVPNKRFLFAKASADSIIDPVAFTFLLRGVQEMGSERRVMLLNDTGLACYNDGRWLELSPISGFAKWAVQ